MNKKQKSREHHWWPVALQKYWADKRNNVSWVNPDGEIESKRAISKRRNKIGYKSHGHTVFRGSDWETNFEDDFSSADNNIPEVITALQDLKPLGRTPKEFWGLIKLLLKKDGELKDTCKFYHLDEQIHRRLLLIIFSLLIRSPSSRNKYEGYPKMFGLPRDADTGKGNMKQNYSIAKKLCETGFLSNQYFVLIHSPFKRFIFGDGNYDWLTADLVANRISGRALVPLTPQICVYFCTPNPMISTPNCASFSAAPWMVDWINSIVQIYSQKQLFFFGKPPKLTDAFRQKQFLQHTDGTDELIKMLDEIAGNGQYDFISRQMAFGR